MLYQQNEAERAKRLTGTGRRDGTGAAAILPGGGSWGMLDQDADENLGKATVLNVLGRLWEWLVSRV